jgi:hypothetical protein
MQMLRRQFIAWGVGSAASAVYAGQDIVKDNTRTAQYSSEVDTTAASVEVADFFVEYFKAKTNRDVDRLMSFWSPAMVTYTDSTLGWDTSGFTSLRSVYEKYMPKWGDGSASYPSRILGNMNSAMVFFTDTPTLFGGEIRPIGVVDFKDKKIVRWIDYWDSRGWPNSYGLKKTSLSDYQEAKVGSNASALFERIAAELCNALSSGDLDAAASLFSYDAAYEDLTLRTEIFSRSAIRRYLERVQGQTPFGTGMRVRHVVGGSTSGGGFEWFGGTRTPVHAGVSAIVINDQGLIKKITISYDGASSGSESIKRLAALALEP